MVLVLDLMPRVDHAEVVLVVKVAFDVVGYRLPELGGEVGRGVLNERGVSIDLAVLQHVEQGPCVEWAQDVGAVSVLTHHEPVLSHDEIVFVALVAPSHTRRRRVVSLPSRTRKRDLVSVPSRTRREACSGLRSAFDEAVEE